MRKVFSILIFSIILLIPIIEAFRNEVPPPMIINNNTNLTINFLTVIGGASFFGDLYMNNNSIFNATFVNLATLNATGNLNMSNFNITNVNTIFVTNIVLNGTPITDIFVPYENATRNVNLGIYNLTANRYCNATDCYTVTDFLNNSGITSVNGTDLNITKLIISSLSNCDTINTTEEGELICGTDGGGAGGGDNLGNHQATQNLSMNNFSIFMTINRGFCSNGSNIVMAANITSMRERGYCI